MVLFKEIVRDASKPVVRGAFLLLIALVAFIRIGVGLRPFLRFSMMILTGIFQGFKLLLMLFVVSLHLDVGPPCVSFGLTKFDKNFISLLLNLLNALLALFNEFILDELVFVLHI